MFPSDYYWHEGMTEWKRLAELPSGKSVLATPAQRQMLANHGLPFDEFTTKYQVSKLIKSRPCTDRQRSFMDDLGIVNFDGMTESAQAHYVRKHPEHPQSERFLREFKTRNGSNGE